jgi:CDP-diacylglycerol---glycerol-3-phosphate 3-phosphatidyltransferase
MNLPNQLTILRIILAFVCIYLIWFNTLQTIIAALIIFSIAAITDYLDGQIARRKNLITNLGKLLDPIADKILIIGVFLAFLELDLISLWVVIVIVSREFIITSLRLVALKQNKVLAAEFHGKHKMISQVAAIIIILIIIILHNIYTQHIIVNWLYYDMINLLMWYVLLITTFSGGYYLWKNKQVIKNL